MKSNKYEVNRNTNDVDKKKYYTRHRYATNDNYHEAKRTFNFHKCIFLTKLIFLSYSQGNSLEE